MMIPHKIILHSNLKIIIVYLILLSIQIKYGLAIFKICTITISANELRVSFGANAIICKAWVTINLIAQSGIVL